MIRCVTTTPSERRKVVIALDQGRRWPEAAQCEGVKLPHWRSHRGAVGVDQQGCASRILIFGEPSQMDFANFGEWQGIQVRLGIPVMIDAGDIGVIHIEQQTAAGAADDGADKRGFVQSGRREFDISGGILQQDAALQVFLGLIDMIADAV